VLRHLPGLILNESWFAAPADLVGYLLRSYRPAFVNQLG
jgi:hypothetical protein